MNTIDISPTKPIVIGVINQLSYLGGTTLYSRVSTIKSHEIPQNPITSPRNPIESHTGWWLTYPSEKYEFVSWGDEIPNIWKNEVYIWNHQPVQDGAPQWCLLVYNPREYYILNLP